MMFQKKILEIYNKQFYLKKEGKKRIYEIFFLVGIIKKNCGGGVPGIGFFFSDACLAWTTWKFANGNKVDYCMGPITKLRKINYI